MKKQIKENKPMKSVEYEVKQQRLSKESIDHLSDKINNIFAHFNLGDVENEHLPYLIQWFKYANISKESTIEIIDLVGNLNKQSTIIDGIFNEEITKAAPQTHFLEILDEEEYETLSNLIDPKDKKKDVISYRISDDTSIITNFKTKQVYQAVSRKENDTRYTTILDCVPKKVIVYDSTLIDGPRSFKIIWESNLTSRDFTTAGEGGGATIKEIGEYLDNAGYSIFSRLTNVAVTSTINSHIKKDLAIIQKEVDNPGYYWDKENHKIIPIHKEIRQPSEKELARATDILDKLAEFFDGSSNILSSVIKWGMIAPFSYAKKQLGKWLPWLYLKGASKAGKTTIAKIALFLHGKPQSGLNVVGGSSFDTVPRIGAKISQSCDPVVVNEPAGAFNKHSVVEMVKVAVESTTGRGKYIGGSYQNVPAFAPVIFTANQHVPDDDALIRRFYILNFSYSMRKKQSDVNRFEKEFRVDAPETSPLLALKAIGEYVANEIYHEPELLEEDWLDISNAILLRLYADIEREMPEWLKHNAKSESLDDYEASQIEDIRNVLVRIFNQNRKKITMQTESGYAVDSLDIDGVSTSSDFEHITWEILNERMIEGMVTKKGRDNKLYVCLTQGFRKELGQQLNNCMDLKSIAELLEWDYSVLKINGKNTRVIKVEFERFLNFVYPEFDDDEETT